eukprot:symbB.v1.2.019280.t1/scaffold1573.1/size110978/6
MGDDFFPVVSPTVVPSEPKVRLKPRWLNVKAPAPLQATLANVAHLEMGMMLGADDEEVAKMMCRPYTSVGSTQFNESCSQFSLRPSSLYSGHSRWQPCRQGGRCGHGRCGDGGKAFPAAVASVRGEGHGGGDATGVVGGSSWRICDEVDT